MSTSKEVAVPDAKSTAAAIYDYGNDVGAGFEDVKAGDFKPSFVRILQANSPQVIDELPGCKAGKLWDNISGETFSEMLFVAAVREHVFVAWKPRNEGGGGGQGFGGVFKPESQQVLSALKKFNSEHESKFEKGDDGKVILPKLLPDEEFDLVETDYYHGVQVTETGAMYPITLPFASTALPVSGNWFSTMGRQFIPNTTQRRPMFGHIFRIASLKKEKGQNKWYVPTVNWAKDNAEGSLLDPASAVFQAARAVSVAFKEGRAKVDYASGGGADSASKSDGGGNSAGKKGPNGDEIPF